MGKMKYVKEACENHSSELVFVGQSYWFKVKSGSSGESYDVSVSVNCPCAFKGREGLVNGWLCSHEFKVFKDIVDGKYPELFKAKRGGR